MSEKFGHKLIVTIITGVFLIIVAIIGITPHFKKTSQSNDEEILKQIDSIKKELVQKRKATVPVKIIGTKEDAYLAALISALANMVESIEPVKISTDGKYIKTEKIRQTLSNEISENLHLRTLKQVERGILISDQIYLHLTSNLTDSYTGGLFEINNGVLTRRPENISFFDLERYINKIGAFVIGSEVKRNGDTNSVTVNMRYDLTKSKLKTITKKKFLDVEGFGLFFEEKITK